MARWRTPRNKRVARVVLNGNLKQLSGGTSEFELDVKDVRQLFAQLGERYPELAPHLEEGIAVAIDGEIFQDALFAAIGPDSEVHVIAKIAGG
jgi:molybdopterin converting factor small subunit